MVIIDHKQCWDALRRTLEDTEILSFEDSMKILSLMNEIENKVFK